MCILLLFFVSFLCFSGRKKDVLQAVSTGCYHILYIFTQNNINELTTNKSYLYILTLYRF